MHAIELWVWLALSFWEFPPIQHNSVIHLGQPLQARLSPPSAVAFPLQSRSFPKTSFWRHKVWTFFSFLFSYLLSLSQCKQTTNINFQTLYCCLSDWEPGLSDKQILKTCLTTLLDDCKGWLVLCVLGKSLHAVCHHPCILIVLAFWQEALSTLPSIRLCVHLPRTCRYGDLSLGKCYNLNVSALTNPALREPMAERSTCYFSKEKVDPWISSKWGKKWFAVPNPTEQVLFLNFCYS